MVRKYSFQAIGQPRLADEEDLLHISAMTPSMAPDAKQTLDRGIPVYLEHFVQEGHDFGVTTSGQIYTKRALPDGTLEETGEFQGLIVNADIDDRNPTGVVACNGLDSGLYKQISLGWDHETGIDPITGKEVRLRSFLREVSLVKDGDYPNTDILNYTSTTASAGRAVPGRTYTTAIIRTVASHNYVPSDSKLEMSSNKDAPVEPTMAVESAESSVPKPEEDAKMAVEMPSAAITEGKMEEEKAAPSMDLDSVQKAIAALQTSINGLPQSKTDLEALQKSMENMQKVVSGLASSSQQEELMKTLKDMTAATKINHATTPIPEKPMVTTPKMETETETSKMMMELEQLRKDKMEMEELRKQVGASQSQVRAMNIEKARAELTSVIQPTFQTLDQMIGTASGDHKASLEAKKRKLEETWKNDENMLRPEKLQKIRDDCTFVSGFHKAVPVPEPTGVQATTASAMRQSDYDRKLQMANAEDEAARRTMNSRQIHSQQMKQASDKMTAEDFYLQAYRDFTTQTGVNLPFSLNPASHIQKTTASSVPPSSFKTKHTMGTVDSPEARQFNAEVFALHPFVSNMSKRMART